MIRFFNMDEINMQPTISRVLFYSLIFAIGVAPTAAMWVIKMNNVDFIMDAFIGLTLLFVLVFVPIILIQNSYLLYKRHDIVLDKKLTGLSRFYAIANGICLISWVLFMLWDKL